MGNDNGLGIFFGFVFLMGFFIGGTVSHWSTNAGWEEQAIEHNAAQYHPTTGEFEWVLPAAEGG
jgi:hypothetical protein